MNILSFLLLTILIVCTCNGLPVENSAQLKLSSKRIKTCYSSMDKRRDKLGQAPTRLRSIFRKMKFTFFNLKPSRKSLPYDTPRLSSRNPKRGPPSRPLSMPPPAPYLSHRRRDHTFRPRTTVSNPRPPRSRSRGGEKDSDDAGGRGGGSSDSDSDGGGRHGGSGSYSGSDSDGGGRHGRSGGGCGNDRKLGNGTKRRRNRVAKKRRMQRRSGVGYGGSRSETYDGNRFSGDCSDLDDGEYKRRENRGGSSGDEGGSGRNTCHEYCKNLHRGAHYNVN